MIDICALCGEEIPTWIDADNDEQFVKSEFEILALGQVAHAICVDATLRTKCPVSTDAP